MRILIVEDERVAARGLEHSVREILGARIQSIRIEPTITASECFIEDNPLDLLLLDLNLQGADGMQLLKMAAASSFHTIIVSANTDRALQAFEFGVLDFVPKPVEINRLRQALARLESGVPGHRRQMNCLAVRDDELIELVHLQSVLYMRADDNYVCIYSADGQQWKHRKTMDAISLTLPDNFVRIHRSYIVNANFAQGIHTHPGGKYELELSNKEKLPMSRSYYKILKNRF